MNTFDDVPLDATGHPMLVAQSAEDFKAYIAWLGDYLYRPDVDDLEVPLSEQEAGLKLIRIEIEIASAIWKSPFDDYPPTDRLPPSGQRHGDILHRRDMSEVLSLVPERATRIRLIESFYAELNDDMAK